MESGVCPEMTEWWLLACSCIDEVVSWVGSCGDSVDGSVSVPCAEAVDCDGLVHAGNCVPSESHSLVHMLMARG